MENGVETLLGGQGMRGWGGQVGGGGGGLQGSSSFIQSINQLYCFIKMN